MFACVTLCLLLFRAISSATVNTHEAKYLQLHSFEMGQAKVTYCQKIQNHAALKKRGHETHPKDTDEQSNITSQVPTSTNPPRTKPLDLTPASFTNYTCYPGTFQAPSIVDCSVVVHAQLYESFGSLEAPPGTWVFVSYGTCATVFQNPEESSDTLQYNWAQLGNRAQFLAESCLQDQENSMGGAGLFEKYLSYKLDGVMISLQRFDDRDIMQPN